MKRILIGLLGFLMIVNSSGQWYKEEYGVDRIEMLSTEQFAEAEKSCLDLAGTGGAVFLLGGVSLVAGYLYHRNGLGEDPGFIEELLGPELMGTGLMALGCGLSVAGIITGTTGLVRLSTVRSAKNRFNVSGSVNMSPLIVYNKYSATTVHGISFKITF